VNLANYFYTFVKWRQTYLCCFSRSSQIWRAWFFLLTPIRFRKFRNGAIGIL